MPDSLDVEHFRSRLVQMRDEILSLRESRDASAAPVKLDQCAVGRLSRMDALQQQAMAQDNRQRAEQQLLRITAALRRLDEGRYGDCLECDEPIDPRRLESDPAATLCISCASKREGSS
ncbi:MAG: TraR/DksA family transcriptional regulator [Thiogranum sp.]|nr:TraR/DksA family transcriptional regulator [Thiogranum sp.]